MTPPTALAKTETTPVKKHRVSGYRDFPDGNQNERFSYQVKDFDEAFNFLEKSRAKGQKIRSAYFNGQRIPNDGL